MKQDFLSSRRLYRFISLLSVLALLGLSIAAAAGEALAAANAPGAVNAAQMVRDIMPGSQTSYPERFVSVNGILYFHACDAAYGCEPWRSDGTTAGTYMVKDVNPGSASSYPFDFVAYGGYFNDSVIYFIADGGSGYQIWKSDGTAAGTMQASAPLLNPDELTVVGNELYFTADDPVYGRELWNNNGTYGGSMLIQDINPGLADSSPTELTPFQGGLLFFARDDFHDTGAELWRCYSAVMGAVLVKDIYPGPQSGVNSELIILGNKVIFTGVNPTYGAELWQSDGTTAGTVLLADITPGSNPSLPENLTLVQNRVFFMTYYDKALRVTDGTTAGTHLVQDMDDALGYGELTAYKGRVCFRKYGTVGYASISELWCSDGVSTTRVDTVPGYSYVLRLLAVSDTSLYLLASDGVQHGNELWRTNGTTAGTHMVQDICVGGGSSEPSPGLAAGSRLFFVADDCQNGRELWMYDEALQTTHQVFLPITVR